MTQPNSGALQKLITEAIMLWGNENMDIARLDYVPWSPNLLHSNQVQLQLLLLDRTLILDVLETKSVNHLLNALQNIDFRGKLKDVRWEMEGLESVAKISLVTRVRYNFILNRRQAS